PKADIAVRAAAATPGHLIPAVTHAQVECQRVGKIVANLGKDRLVLVFHITGAVAEVGPVKQGIKNLELGTHRPIGLVVVVKVPRYPFQPVTQGATLQLDFIGEKLATHHRTGAEQHKVGKKAGSKLDIQGAVAAGVDLG